MADGAAGKVEAEESTANAGRMTEARSGVGLKTLRGEGPVIEGREARSCSLGTAFRAKTATRRSVVEGESRSVGPLKFERNAAVGRFCSRR